ncbi:CDP-diacylglycerol--glycerol-3-phosphate 3-phosphatidyltransferase [endosymbiont of unidentified scaly snail isolate Monju]|uniref:CDP-diacylglycerol--glycerol-3-phosphate 3-phosphatidyltransferase n=1 Tax=endosymbiont of unidentified scaly snail isolate Monju TaxID=1248727 RepID=UPI0003892DE7|nr:CDP-diacylglycerol--glycerol-3-phosphate 3-phosphatidyltransferase [endosymbiont of unidentified scaly snail isolate Monju]BAN69027.1 CDP-diacylglycerol--glycerol-3-phosphate 3-phosphatidyltransferase [endosymbiont of unidentified scaly snail isolate Monju]
MNSLHNLPNLLTLGRIALIPVFVLVYYLPVSWASPTATWIFVAAALTDWLDGYLARRMRLTSPLGAFLDPVADKLMVATALVVVLQADPRLWLALPVMVIIGREITISALREWMAEIGERAQVAVSELGKFKTAAQMLAITLLIYRDDLWGLPIYVIGEVLLYIAVVLTLWSMVIYLRAAWPHLGGGGGTGKSADPGLTAPGESIE